LIRLPDGSLRVRKVSKGTGSPGPWGVATLRREIQYLRSLPAGAAELFPPLLAAWDDGKQLGYEMSYIADSADAGKLAQNDTFDQQQADGLQNKLGEAVFERLHVPVRSGCSLAAHVRQTVTDALARLHQQREFTSLIDLETIEVNGNRVAGARSAWQRLLKRPKALTGLEAGPQVRLHGDFFLENVLLTKQADGSFWPGPITLIDPVSVAGICQGHPMFDLVKYESYATGELPAMRSEKVECKGFDQPAAGRYAYRVCREDPAIQPFARIDWHGRLRSHFLAKYGEIDRCVYHLLEAYFAIAMALCTEGRHRQARVLRTVMALDAATCPS
jgi:hypothetical protein